MPQADAKGIGKVLGEQGNVSPLGVSDTHMNLDESQVGSHGLVNTGVFPPNLKLPYLKKAPPLGLLTVKCIFESESQMLRSGYFEREILSPTTAAMVEPGAM